MVYFSSSSSPRPSAKSVDNLFSQVNFTGQPNTMKHPVTDQRRGCLIPHVAYRFLQSTGFFPRCFSPKCLTTDNGMNSKLVNEDLNMLLSPTFSIVSCIIGLVCVSGITTYTIGDWSIRKQQVVELEFFTIITLFLSLTDLVQAPLMLLLMVWNSHRLVPLITRIEQVLNEVVTNKKMSEIRVVTFCCLTWHISCIATLCVVEYGYTYSFIHMQGDTLHLNWTTLTNYPTPQSLLLVPIYATTIWNIITMVVTLNCQLVPQYLLIVLVLSITSICDYIEHELAQHPIPFITLRKSRFRFRKVKSLVNELNEFFSLIVLLSCLRDLLTSISFLATLLSRLEQANGELDADFLVRKNDQVASLVIVYWMMVTGAGTAAGRLVALLYCYGKESSIRKRLQCQHANMTDESLDEEFTNFLGELDGTGTAISGGGFFLVTKEYLATTVGLLFAYLILIYQTRDNKGDMRELISAKNFDTRIADLSRELQEKIAAAIANQSASR